MKSYFLEDPRYIELARTLLKAFFQKSNDFNSFYDAISSAEAKVKFLRLLHFYKFYYSDLLIKKSTPESYLVLGLFAFIESLMSNGHKNFFDYLVETAQFPISDKGILGGLHSSYLDEFGSTRSVLNFFSKYVNDGDKERLIGEFRAQNRKAQKWLNGRGEDLNTQTSRLIKKILYQIRNDFVHGAKIINHFNQEEVFSTVSVTGDSKNVTIVKLTVKEFGEMILRGFLNYFGYQNHGWHGSFPFR